MMWVSAEEMTSKDATNKAVSLMAIVLRIKGVRKQKTGVPPRCWVMEGESVKLSGRGKDLAMKTAWESKEATQSHRWGCWEGTGQ